MEGAHHNVGGEWIHVGGDFTTGVHTWAVIPNNASEASITQFKVDCGLGLQPPVTIPIIVNVKKKIFAPK